MPPDITQLLNRMAGGDEHALNEVTPLIYDELKRIARGIFSGERQGHTLQPTALVHEAYAKLVSVETDWQDRAHFYALAARMMRRLLVNHAAAKHASKRGGNALRMTLQDDQLAARQPTEDVIALDEALAELASFDARKAQVLELHYFGGLSQPEAATVLSISESTVRRELRIAKAWLRKTLD